MMTDIWIHNAEISIFVIVMVMEKPNGNMMET